MACRHHFLLILISLLYCGDCFDQDIGPKHIVRYEGENNVFIPCPLIQLSLPFWEIDGVIYEPFTLPPQYISAPNGLLIPKITANMNGTTIACYFSTGNRFAVGRSSTGSLIVKKRDDIGLDYSQNEKKAGQYVYLDNQNMHFDEDYTYIAWKPPSSGFKYRTKIESGSTFDSISCIPYYACTTNKTSIRIQNSLARDVYFNMTFLIGKDFNIAYRSLQKLLYINSSVITQKLMASYAKSFSIEVPNYLDQYPVVVLPTNTSGRDCFCPVFLEPVQNSSCADISRCNCVNQSVSDLLSSINICNSTEGTLHIYFRNLTRQLNGTRFHLCYYSKSYPYYVIYFSSFEIVEVLPEPPVVLLNPETNEVIFYSEQRAGVSLGHYELTLSDVTGQQVYDDTFPWLSQENYTVDLNLFSDFLDICSPFLVSVKAVNAFGYSDTNLTVKPTGAGDICSCLMRKINIHLKEITYANNYKKVSIMARCNHSYSSESDISLNIMIDDRDAQPIQCFSNSTVTTIVTYDKLRCERSYNASARWMPPAYINVSMECILEDIEARPSCTEERILEITLPIAFFMLLVIVITVTILIWCLSRKYGWCNCK